FWQFPTVSMGIAPINAIYQARFMRYLENRGLIAKTPRKVWAFLGDGEMDEPESMGSLTLGSREKLDNLIFVINCNLQRLDGPVRGNGKVIQELEAAFRGAGWNVIKVIWGSDWDPLFERDTEGLLAKRLGEVVDGEFQKYAVEGGAYVREHLFGTDPRLLKLVEPLSDEQLKKLSRGGHDPLKVYAAYKAALEHPGQPTVILAHTIKGYGLGEAGEARNTTHQQKKLTEDALKKFRARFSVPVPEDKLKEMPFYRPKEDSDEIKYLLERRRALGGPMPQRVVRSKPMKAPPLTAFKDFLGGSGKSEVSTTGAFVGILKGVLLRDKAIGKQVVPIIPFYIYYSMFGFQRVGDQIWLAGDMRVRGFLLGATAGRTTLNGEGLQHQDGHSHLVAATVPNVVAYDPAYAFEIAVIL